MISLAMRRLVLVLRLGLGKRGIVLGSYAKLDWVRGRVGVRDRGTRLSGGG